MGLDQANGLADLLTRAPLAGFLALTLLVVGALFGLLMREKSAHQKTIREVVVLTGAISAQWTRQLDLQAQSLAVLERVATRLEQPRRRSTGSNPAAGLEPETTTNPGRVSPITQSGYPNPLFVKPPGASDE